MKLLLSILLFFFSLALAETMVNILDIDIEISLVESSGEGNSEKETSETSEDDSKIESSLPDKGSKEFYSSHHQGNANAWALTAHHVEISIPPPR